MNCNIMWKLIGTFPSHANRLSLGWTVLKLTSMSLTCLPKTIKILFKHCAFFNQRGSRGSCHLGHKAHEAKQKWRRMWLRYGPANISATILPPYLFNFILDINSRIYKQFGRLYFTRFHYLIIRILTRNLHPEQALLQNCTWTPWAYRIKNPISQSVSLHLEWTLS